MNSLEFALIIFHCNSGRTKSSDGFSFSSLKVFKLFYPLWKLLLNGYGIKHFQVPVFLIVERGALKVSMRFATINLSRVCFHTLFLLFIDPSPSCRSLSPTLRDRLLYHILALILHCDNFKTIIDDLAVDLHMTADRWVCCRLSFSLVWSTRCQINFGLWPMTFIFLICAFLPDVNG